MKATGSEVLLQVVYYEIRIWCISEANQGSYEKGGETKSYGFVQVIFIV